MRKPDIDEILLDDGTRYWLLEVDGAPEVKFPRADRVLANAAWAAATRAYENGREDARAEMRKALGLLEII